MTVFRSDLLNRRAAAVINPSPRSQPQDKHEGFVNKVKLTNFLGATEVTDLIQAVSSDFKRRNISTQSRKSAITNRRKHFRRTVKYFNRMVSWNDFIKTRMTTTPKSQEKAGWIKEYTSMGYWNSDMAGYMQWLFAVKIEWDCSNWKDLGYSCIWK